MALLIILLLLVILWVVTGKFPTPPQGETMIVGWFQSHSKTIGIGIPEVTIDESNIPEELRDTLLYQKRPIDPNGHRQVKIAIDDTTSSFLILLWPKRVISFFYKRKKFKTLKEIKETKGEIRWQPSIPKDTNGKPIKTENDPETMALGEWTEKMTSLYVREREEIGLKFISRDGIKGIKKAYMKLIIWNQSRAISSVKNFKDDPEKAVFDLFQHYAKEQDFYEGIQGFSFEYYKERQKFLQETNKDIWMTGVLLEDIEFEETYLEPESVDILEEREKIQKEKIKQQVAEESIKTKQREGEALAAKQLAEAQGYQKSQALKADADADYAEKTGKVNNAIEVEKDERLKTNYTRQYQELKKIDLENGGKLIEKLGEYKGIEDKTEVEKMKALGNVKGTVVYHEGGSASGSKLDDKILEGLLIANQTVNPKKQKEDGKQS